MKVKEIDRYDESEAEKDRIRGHCHCPRSRNGADHGSSVYSLMETE